MRKSLYFAVAAFMCIAPFARAQTASVALTVAKGVAQVSRMVVVPMPEPPASAVLAGELLPVAFLIFLFRRRWMSARPV